MLRMFTLALVSSLGSKNSQLPSRFTGSRFGKGVSKMINALSPGAFWNLWCSVQPTSSSSFTVTAWSHTTCPEFPSYVRERRVGLEMRGRRWQEAPVRRSWSKPMWHTSLSCPFQLPTSISVILKLGKAYPLIQVHILRGLFYRILILQKCRS